ncbi:MAG: zinc-ribbon domain-containing protein [Bacillota bacterium]
MSSRFCPQCGKELDANAQFCIYCGANQTLQPAAQAPPEPPPVAYPQPVNAGARPPRKKWPIFVIIGVAAVVIAAAALLLTGVIKLGGAAFAPADINGEWSAQMSLDDVIGTGSEADSLRQYKGQTRSGDVNITLDQNGKGTAEINNATYPAELTGSSLVIKGQAQYGASDTVDYTGSITKTADGYAITGSYSSTQSGLTIKGQLKMQKSGGAQNTSTPIATEAPYYTPMPTPYPTYSYTTEPTAYTTQQTTMLEGTYQCMYDVDNSNAALIEFKTDGTCVTYTTEETERVPGTYILSGNTLSLTRYPIGKETEYYTYQISMGTGQFTLTNPSTGQTKTFVQVE